VTFPDLSGSGMAWSQDGGLGSFRRGVVRGEGLEVALPALAVVGNKARSPSEQPSTTYLISR
jgi:hypothetical protein